MKCQRCDHEAKFEVKEIATSEEKTYILCTHHFVELCAYMVKEATIYVYGGKSAD